MASVSEEAACLRAAELARPLGFITGLFAACLRHLHSKKSVSANEGGLDSAGRWLIERFVGSASIKVCFYYLSLTHHEAQVSGKESVSIRDLVNLYSPKDLACILSLVYLFRSIKTLCPPQEWAPLASTVQDAADIGGTISTNVHGLDFGDGVLIPSIRYLALGLFLCADGEKYKGYAEQVIGARKGFDCALEQKLWGCNHVQVAAVLLERAGFDRDYIAKFKSALLTPPQTRVTYAVNRLRMVAVIANAMYLGLEQPAIVGEEEFEMSQQSLESMQSRIETITRQGSNNAWLLKGKDDAAAGKVVGIYKPKAAEPEAQPEETEPEDNADLTAAFKVPYEELPPGVKERFPRGELEDLRGTIKDLVKAQK